MVSSLANASYTYEQCSLRLGKSPMELNKLPKQNILVTGGTGFAGRHAIEKLLDDGYVVYALVREREKLVKILGNYESDLLKVMENSSPEKASVSDLKRLIEDNDITTIIHIAALVGEHKISWDRYFEVNVLWTRNLALAFLEANVNRNKFIFTSSVGVYGTIPKHVPADEDTPYNPDGSYHKSKVLAEKELIELQSNSGLPLIILRPTILYGKRDRGFLFKVSELIASKRFPLSNRNPFIHLLDVELLADVYAKIVGFDGRPTSSILNVGDNRPVRIGELIQSIAKSMNGGYMKVPSFVFALLTKLSAFNRQYSISLKLISKSWFYNVEKLHETFNFSALDTIPSLEKKYIEWYKGAADVG
jgi:nucleoside-diphosphate-sugar epimerase